MEVNISELYDEYSSINKLNDDEDMLLKILICLPYKVELSIKMSLIYSLTIVHESMMYIYDHYCSQEYIGERNQYRWQKELIDMIEGS